MNSTITIGSHRIGRDDDTFVIAEAGVNHNGELKLAKRLVDEAAQAGADAVKFQTFDTDQLVSHDAGLADYQQQTVGGAESQRDMLRGLELERDDFLTLRDRARDQGLVFLSSPFDRQSLEWLIDFGVPAIKVPSGEITNVPLLEAIADTELPAIISTGMTYFDEVARAVRVFEDANHDEFMLLHCVSEYPVDPRFVNLRAMDTLRDAFRVPVGFSDHTLGIEVPTAAVARGACVVEKHFTLDKTMEGPDHRASLEPDELSSMIDAIRSVEVALGERQKQPAESEQSNRELTRKSLGLARDRPEGARLEEEDLVPLRPAIGIEPSMLESVLGRQLDRDKPRGSILTEEDLR